MRPIPIEIGFNRKLSLMTALVYEAFRNTTAVIG